MVEQLICLLLSTIIVVTIGVRSGGDVIILRDMHEYLSMKLQKPL